MVSTGTSWPWLTKKFFGIVLLFALTVLSTSFSNSLHANTETSQAANENPWRFMEDTNGVKVYLRDYPDSKSPEFKAATTVESSMSSIIAVLLDSEACPRWVHQCKHAFTIITVNAREQYVYQQNQLPLVRDRDIILHATLSHQDNGKIVTIELEAAPDYCDENALPRCEEIRDSKLVRVKQATGYYRLIEIAPNIVDVIWQQHIDPAGFLPGWLARSQLLNLPLKSLHALHDLVQETRYQQTGLMIDEDGLRVTYEESQSVEESPTVKVNP